MLSQVNSQSFGDDATSFSSQVVQPRVPKLDETFFTEPSLVDQQAVYLNS